ncbi:MAG: hypothetical protein M3Y77_21860 [Actinomycetota bacterium]|nr:hypothetical protein [Actinomycetota bacterium]
MTGAPWWVLVLTTAIGAAAGIGGSVLATTLQNKSTGRQEWFRRVQWAETLANARGDRQQAAGLRILRELATSDLAGTDDVAMIAALIPAGQQHELAARATTHHNGDPEPMPDSVIAAAQLRVTVDRRLGRSTPATIAAIATGGDAAAG